MKIFQQHQEQNQTQEQLKLSTLNRWMESLSDLDKFDSVPINFEIAKFCTGDLLYSIDDCISQTLGPVLQVKRDISESLKKRFIFHILEWQSLRNKKDFDIIDELCSIVIWNCLGQCDIKVPYRIQEWDGNITPEELEKLVLTLGRSNVEIEKMISDCQRGVQVEFKEITKSKKGDAKIGLERYKSSKKELYAKLKTVYLFT
jgi:hypothetical protein